MPGPPLRSTLSYKTSPAGGGGGARGRDARGPAGLFKKTAQTPLPSFATITQGGEIKLGVQPGAPPN
jgi:hypothetical protein